MLASSPLVLAVDTSTLTLSVALTRGDAPLAELSLHLPRGHSRALLGTIDQLVTHAGSRLEAVDIFAVGLGPGSFTGLRIGLALLKGLALGYDVPLRGASSLQAIAERVAARDGLVCPVIDARKAEVYSCLYRAAATPCGERRLTALTEEMVIAPEQLAEQVLLLAPGDAPILFMGTGASAYRDALSSACGGRARFADPALVFPSALHIARLALASGDGPSLTNLEPRYIRPSDAELGIPRPSQVPSALAVVTQR